MALKIPRLLKNRLGVYCVRAYFFDQNGIRKVKQVSLKTKDCQIARVLALKFNLELEQNTAMATKKPWLDELFEDKINPVIPNLDSIANKFELDLSKGVMKSDGPEDHARMMEAIKAYKDLHGVHPTLQEQMNMGRARPPEFFPTNSAITPTVGVTLKEALNQHLEEEIRRGFVAKTRSEKTAVFADFLGFFGEDTQLNAISRERIGISGGWRDKEYKTPNSKNKDKKRSGVTLEKRRGYLSKFFQWAIESGKYNRENPMSQKMATKGEIKDQRKEWMEFDSNDIKALFCDKYAQEMNKPDFYWLPLMALFSGARLGELARLELSNFSDVDGVKHYRITEGKTAGSKRSVPIHSQLLKLGLWEYVEALKAKNEIFFLPHRPQDPPQTSRNNRTKDPEKMTGRQWGLWVEKCGITDKKKVFHSFRSTVITDLHNTDAKESTIQRSVGHTGPAMSGVHGQTYVREIALKNLQKAVECLNHPQVDFEALKLTDPTFSSFFDKLEADAKDPRKIEAAEKKARHEKAKAEREERNRDKRKTMKNDFHREN